MDPDPDVTPEAMLLRDLEFVVRAFVLSVMGSTSDPEPVPLTAAEREAAAAREREGKADLMTPEQALDRLGLRRRGPMEEVGT